MDFDPKEEKTFFFDLDKTIWNWDSTVIGAEDTVESLRSADKNVYFHTDNTLLTRQKYAEKLSAMNIPAEKKDVITSGYVAAKTLEEKGVNEAYVIGENGLINELEQKNINISKNAENVVVGFDRQFNYTKLSRAMNILENGGQIYFCSTENTFRKSESRHPHQGMTNQAFKQITEGKLIGKPSEVYRDIFKDYFDFFPRKSVFIGDRLEDIEAGNRLGMTTLAVMSGEINRDQLRKAKNFQKPDYGLSSLVKLKRKII